MKAGPPALPCRDDVVVESGPAASESCLPSMEMRSSTAAGGLVPTGEASTVSETTLNEPPLRFCPTEETDLERIVRRLRLHTPHSKAAAFSGGCYLLHTAGVSLTQNPGKVGPLMQAVLDVASAPARFWDRGTRWFVARIYGLRQLERSFRFTGSLE